MTLLRDFGPMHHPDVPADRQTDAAVALVEVDVALVDDDPVMAALVKRILTRRGYSVIWFADGQAALAALCRPAISVRAKLVLLDVSMPGMGGFDVISPSRSISVCWSVGSKVYCAEMRSDERN